MIALSLAGKILLGFALGLVALGVLGFLAVCWAALWMAEERDDN